MWASGQDNEPHDGFDDDYLRLLLNDQRFWATAAVSEPTVVGALTAWMLPLTSKKEHELFIYDLAVDPAHWRQGYGRGLVESLQQQAVDNEDTHALDFYQSLGGAAAPSTIFTFGEPS